MESSGLPGRIQISEQTAAMLDDDFEIKERGMVEIKGKGLMKTFWLVGHRQSEAPAALLAKEAGK